MTTQTESQIKHHPDDWSFTSNHHHHVERTVHPVIVELIKWVYTLSYLTFLHAPWGANCEKPSTHILLPLLQREWIHDLKFFNEHRMLTPKSDQATQTLPPTSSSAILDDGCGIGTVTAEVKKAYPDLSVLAIDSSAGMLEAVNRQAKKHDWKNVTTRLLDGGDLTGISIRLIPFQNALYPDPRFPSHPRGNARPISSNHAHHTHFPAPNRLDADPNSTQGVSSASFSHAFACTYIDLAHNATACIKELHRVIAPGGVLAINTWADPIHPSIATPWTKACQTLYPGFKAPFVTSPKWSTAEMIKENLEKAGFKDVQTKQVLTHWRWAGPDEMTEWFFNGGNPVCKRWHEALVDEVGGKLEGMRERFHEELEKEYRNEGGQLLKEELVNLTIARK